MYDTIEGTRDLWVSTVLLAKTALPTTEDHRHLGGRAKWELKDRALSWYRFLHDG